MVFARGEAAGSVLSGDRIIFGQVSLRNARLIMRRRDPRKGEGVQQALKESTRCLLFDHQHRTRPNKPTRTYEVQYRCPNSERRDQPRADIIIGILHLKQAICARTRSIVHSAQQVELPAHDLPSFCAAVRHVRYALASALWLVLRIGRRKSKGGCLLSG